MNLAGFCRNCLAKWYLAAAEKQGLHMTYEEAREVVYGVAFPDWKKQHQKEASEEQLKLFEETKPLHADISGH
jgi:hypothetical protein